MSGILSSCSVWLPFLLGAIFMILFLFFLFKLISKYPKTFWTIFITAIIVSIFTLVSNKFIFPRLARMFFPKRASQEWIIYDTDPLNDQFIKGTLKQNKMKKFDRILMQEKREGGGRLSNQELNELTKYDNELIEAYNRWRKCKDMRRSHHRVIYPDERELYHYLK